MSIEFSNCNKWSLPQQKFKEKGIDLSLSSDKFCYGANYPDAIDSMPEYDSGDKSGDKIKSFLPGLYMNTNKGYAGGGNSLYTPDKTAGVDAAGLLLGSLAMSETPLTILNALNENVTEELDGYYKMEGKVPDLDEKGLPAYYVAGNVKSYLEGNYRLIDFHPIAVP